MPIVGKGLKPDPEKEREQAQAPDPAQSNAEEEGDKQEENVTYVLHPNVAVEDVGLDVAT